MSLKENLLSDMKVAMKEKDVLRKNTIQMVRGAILQKEKDTLKEVTEEQILDIIMQEIKKRKDALVDFEKGDRQDLAEAANIEITVLTGYLPKQLSDDEIFAIVRETITEVGAQSLKDMGKVMAATTPKVKGKADNGKVSGIVKQCLTQ
ncbi:MAG: GatB/YqeY protein [Clostridia bacterium]|nr:GatB/YqeY protein [Clostridia bacterium]